MKKIVLLTICLFTLLSSCNSDKKDDKKEESIATKEEIKHYICDNNCEGSGSDVAGVCTTCNKPYTHNQAYHDKDLLKTGPLEVPKKGLGNETNPTNASSPIQNAQGVYHYICPNGCAGGGGTTEPCKSCGADLIHNSLYHQS